jgi:purine nucleosidase
MTENWPVAAIRPRQRVVTDNDYGGDPDGLVQLAQLLLSPSVDVPLVVSSHLGAADPFGPAGNSAERGAGKAARIAQLCDRTDVAVVAGSETPMRSPTMPVDSLAARRIVAEAMRDDTELALFVTCGGSLTEVASAWLLEPHIAERLTLVWIGGHEYDGVAEPPPGGGDMEYNTGLDPVAAQVVFNDSELRIWQVPRSTYRMAIASRAELLTRVRRAGELGAHLFTELARIVEWSADRDLDLGEVYVLGDSPLVLLTALWTAFEPGPASSSSVVRPCPRILDSGRYEDRPQARPIRVFTGLDQRLLFEDLYAKLALRAAGEA